MTDYELSGPSDLGTSLNKLDVGICGFPLSNGVNTGRGLERVVYELLRGLEAIGQPYAYHERGVIRNELLAVGRAPEYLADLRRHHSDLWFAVYPVAGIFPILAGKRPVVTGIYDLIPFLATGYDNAVKYFIKRRCIEFSCRRSNGLIVPFPSTAEHISERFGVAKERIEVIPLGIDRRHYYHDPAIAKRRFRIGFLGEAKRAKGLDTAILAFAQVLETLPDAFLTIASRGNELDEMKALARRTLPGERYEFVGFVPDEEMRQYYSELDLFLFPSRYGFGMSPVEAMACGTPAIAARTLDSSDFFTENLSLVEPGSPGELAERIVLLLTNREHYEALRGWGLQRAQALSWDRMAERYVAFWQRIRDEWRTARS
jgi:glycosyltransferase involved in cell wall biosynthesis